MRIEWIDYELPTEIVDNAEIDTLHPEWNVRKAEERTGVLSRRWAEPLGETSLGMATKICMPTRLI